MASSFWEGSFYYDGVHSNSKGVFIIDMNENNILKQIGSTLSISTEKEIAFNGNPLYKETDRTLENIVLQLCKINKKPWKVAEISDIISWLFQDTYKKFQPMDTIYQDSYNLVYYLKAIDYKKFFNSEMDGYLEITFQPFDAYLYAIPNGILSINGGETKNINNLSNINKIYYPKIKIVNLGSETNVITVTNNKNKKTLSLSGIAQNETIFVDCKIGTVQNEKGENRFSTLQNFDFIGLEKGNNSISLSKDCSIEFICEFPMII